MWRGGGGGERVCNPPPFGNNLPATPPALCSPSSLSFLENSLFQRKNVKSNIENACAALRDTLTRAYEANGGYAGPWV